MLPGAGWPVNNIFQGVKTQNQKKYCVKEPRRETEDDLKTGITISSHLHRIKFGVLISKKRLKRAIWRIGIQLPGDEKYQKESLWQKKWRRKR
jgi:hypothetical protein